jgi:hypothetical protein
MEIVATRMVARRPGRLPADWSWQRKAALIVFASIMAYLHSFYILGFYTSDIEYWGTVWIGVTAKQRLLSFGLGLFANLGLMAMPFLRAPGRLMRLLLVISLGCGALISTAWLLRDLWVLGLPEVGRVSMSRGIGFFVIALVFSILNIMIRIFYAIAILLNLWFLMRIRWLLGQT